MGIGGLLSAASALPRRWSVLIATMATLVLAGCSAGSQYSGQTAAPASQPSYAAPASAAQQDYSSSLPYPKQSLADLFRGSTQTQAQSQTQTLPHPPETYTASGQPYQPPPGQQPYGAPPVPGATAATTPPANPDLTDSLPYPKQSLIDLFSNK